MAVSSTRSHFALWGLVCQVYNREAMPLNLPSNGVGVAAIGVEGKATLGPIFYAPPPSPLIKQ